MGCNKSHQEIYQPLPEPPPNTHHDNHQIKPNHNHNSSHNARQGKHNPNSGNHTAVDCIIPQEIQCEYDCEQDYMNEALNIICQSKHLQIALHRSVFDQIKLITKSYYMNKQQKEALTKLLQKYMIYNGSLVSGYPNSTQYTQIQHFGTSYGSQIMKLVGQLQKTRRAVLAILDYKDLYQQNSFVLYINAYRTIKQEIKMMCDNDPISLFYLSSYFIRSCKKMEILNQPHLIANKLSTFLQLILNQQFEDYKTNQQHKPIQTVDHGTHRTHSNGNSSNRNPSDNAQMYNSIYTTDYMNMVNLYMGKQEASNTSHDSARRQMQANNENMNNTNMSIRNQGDQRDKINDTGMSVEDPTQYGQLQDQNTVRQFKNKKYKPLVIDIGREDNQNKEKTIQKIIRYTVDLGNKYHQYFRNLFEQTCKTHKGYDLQSSVMHLRNSRDMFKIKSVLLHEQIHKHRRQMQGQQKQMAKKKEREQTRDSQYETVRKIKNKHIEEWLKEEQLKLKSTITTICHKANYVKLMFTDVIKGSCKFNDVRNIKKVVSTIKSMIQRQKSKSRGMSIDLIQITNSMNQIKKNITINLRIQNMVCEFVLIHAVGLIQHPFEYLIYDKIHRMVTHKTLHPIMLLYQWNQASVKKYMQQLQGHIMRVNNIIEKSIAANNMKILYTILRYHQVSSFTTQSNIQEDGKEKTQGKDKKIGNKRLLKQLKQTRVDPPKSQNASKYKKLNSIVCMKQLKKYQGALKIKDMPEISNNDKYIKSMQLNQVGQIFKKLENYKQSLKYFNQALSIKENVKGKNSIQASEQIQSIASVYRLMNKHPLSLQNYFKSLYIVEKLFGSSNVKYTNIIQKIGEVHYEMQNYQQALKYLNNCFSILTKLGDRDLIESARTLNWIGSTYLQIQQLNEAQRVLSVSLQAYQKYKPKYQLEFVTVLNNMGTLYRLQKNYQQAIEYHKRSLQMLETKKQDNYELYSESIEKLGLVYEQMKRWQATQYYQKSCNIKILKNAKGLVYIKSFVNYIRVQTKSKYFISQWLEKVGEFVQIMNKNYIEETVSRAQFHSSIGLVYYYCSKEQQAYEYLKKSIDIHNRRKEKEGVAQALIQTLDYANTIKLMGELQYKLLKNRKSVQLLMKAKLIYRRVFGTESAKYIRISKDIQDFKTKLA